MLDKFDFSQQVVTPPKFEEQAAHRFIGLEITKRSQLAPPWLTWCGGVGQIVLLNFGGTDRATISGLDI